MQEPQTRCTVCGKEHDAAAIRCPYCDTTTRGGRALGLIALLPALAIGVPLHYVSGPLGTGVGVLVFFVVAIWQIAQQR